MIEIFSLVAGIFLVLISYRFLDERQKNLTVILLLVGIIFFDGLRWEMGTDWTNYLVNFESISSRWTPGFEIGFQAYNEFVSWFTSKYSFYLLITSALIYCGVHFHAYKVSGKSYITFFLLLSTITWYSGSQRQMLATAIFVLGLKFIFQRKFILFTLISLLGLSFHVTYVVLIPLYFLYNIPNKWFYVIFISLLILGNVMSTSLQQLALIINFFNPGKDILERLDGGLETNAVLGFGRKLFTLVPVIYFYYRSKIIREDAKIKFFYHLSLLSFVIYYLGFYFIGILASRLDLYFGLLALPIFLGMVYEKLVLKLDKRLIVVFSVALAVLFYIRLEDWGMSLFHPYSSVFYNYSLNRELF